MNWGHKITLGFAGFFVVIMYLVIRSFQQEINLVSDDYYFEELNYQERIDQIKNVELLDEAITIEWVNSGISLMFPSHVPADQLSGTIHLYRPSTKSGDRRLTLRSTPDYTQFVPGASLSQGRYLVKLQWTDGKEEYYQELPIFIPKQ